MAVLKVVILKKKRWIDKIVIFSFPFFRGHNRKKKGPYKNLHSIWEHNKKISIKM